MRLKSMVPVIAICIAVAFGLSGCSTFTGKSADKKEAPAGSESAPTPKEAEAPGGKPAPRSKEEPAASAADETINGKVKSKLFNDPRLSAFAITARTSQGVVTLTGAVDTKADKARAAELAGSVNGVTSIENLIKLK